MALHRLRERALSLILQSLPSFPAAHAPPVVSLDRLLCSTASTASTVSSLPSFDAEDYLVSRFGLTRARAVKVSRRISHLGSCSKPEAVLAFLSGTLGVPAADVAALISMYPSFLCINVERTLAPRIAELSDLGLSREDIARLIPLAPTSFRSRFLCRKIEFWVKELGSFAELLRVVRMNSSLLCTDLDKVTAPNLAFLRQYGLNASQIVSLNIYSSRLVTMNSNRLQEAVKRVEDLGIKPGSRMFPRALTLISLMAKDVVTRRIQILQKFGFSQDDVREIMRKAPLILGHLGKSGQKVRGNIDFLVKNVGLDFSYIARRPVLLMYSLQRRLLPRYCLLKVLQEKAFIKGKMSYYTTATMSEKNFLQKFVLPYKDVVPGLAEDYALKCFGKLAGRVVSQEERTESTEKEKAKWAYILERTE